MKKINKYLFGAFAALLTAGLFSCVETAPEYVPGAPEVAGCNGVYFPTQEASGEHTFDPTMARVISVTLQRDSLKGATNPLPEIEVAITSSDTTGVFVVPATAKFADGQTETTIDITFDKAKDATKYPLNLSIEEAQNKSVYNNTANYLELSVFCVKWEWFGEKDHKFAVVETENEAAIFNVTFDWFEVETPAKVKFYEVGNYRTGVLIAQNEAGFFGTKVTELNFTWNTKNNDVYVSEQYMGWDYDNQGEGDIPDAVPFEDATSPVFVYDWFSYWVMRGQMSGAPEDFYSGYRGNYPPSYYDKNGGFMFNLKYYIKGLGGWTSFEYDFRALAEGFIRVDYSISVDAYETEEGVAPVEFELGADVTSVKYVIAEGELSAKEAGKLADAISKGKAENVQTIAVESTDTIIGVSPAASGIYTLVAVSYAGEDAKESDFVSFTYVAAEDAEEYAVVFSIGVEPVSSMYERLDINGTNAIQYFMYGEDVTEATIGVYKTSDVEKYGAELCAKSLNPVSEDALAAINGVGYNDIATNLNPLTSYTLVAYANNGYNSAVKSVEFVTEGVPYYPTVDEVVGTYVYEGKSYWEGSDEVDTLVIVPSDNPELGNVMFTTMFGIACEKNVYATVDTENSALIIKDEQPFLFNQQYDGWIYFMLNGATEVTLTFVEEGHFNTPSAWLGYYIDGTAGQGWFNLFTDFDAKKVEEANGVVAKRAPSFTKYFNESVKTKPISVGKKANLNVERNPQTVAVKAVKVERPARPNRFSAPVKMDNFKF